MRRAKIICTLGPATDSARAVEGLIAAGMDVARLNFSHGTLEDHRRRLSWVRRIAQRLHRPVAVIQDVQGPKIRVGQFAGGELPIKANQTVRLVDLNVLGEGDRIPTPITLLRKEVRPGDPILIDDGRIRLLVAKVGRTEVVCRVVNGGNLKDHKGINLPGSPVGVESISAKDERDLAFGQRIGVDYVALSFVRTAEDIKKARTHLTQLNTPVIAKVEKPQAVDHFDSIAAEANGVMIARGDLGVELPLERLPGIQKSAIGKANRQGKLVIVATEMLESMVNSPRPTRAEVSDVANAILDGADAVMLSAETAVGKYPTEAVATMAKVIEDAERQMFSTSASHFTDDPSPAKISPSVAAAAVAAASRLGEATIVAYTESGYTAQLISELRPRSPIFGLTPNDDVVRRMALYWGVQPRRVRRLRSTEAMVQQVKRLCHAHHLCAPGNAVVIVAGVPLNQAGRTNLMTIHRL